MVDGGRAAIISATKRLAVLLCDGELGRGRASCPSTHPICLGRKDGALARHSLSGGVIASRGADRLWQHDNVNKSFGSASLFFLIYKFYSLDQVSVRLP